MKNPSSTQTQILSPNPQEAPQSPGFFGAGAVRGLIHINVDDLADRDDIRKAILKYIKEMGKFRVVMVFDAGDDIFMIKPRPRPLSNSELAELLRKLNIKYDIETGEITEVPENLMVVEIYDGFGTTTIVLKRR